MTVKKLAHLILAFIEKHRGDLPRGQLPTVGCVVLHILAETANARHGDVTAMFDGMKFLREDEK